MAHEEIIARATKHINPHKVGDRVFGTVASVIVTDRGSEYAGVCIDTSSGTGFCAEAAAVGAMVTAGEYRIRKVVAVSRHEDGKLYVLPPCGRCREFMRQVDEGNLEAEVVLGKDESAKLKELLPRHRWPAPL